MTKVVLDKLQASNAGNIESVVGSVVIPNGAPIALGGKVAGNREAVEAVEADATKEVLLLAIPEVQYDEFKEQTDIVLPSGQLGRAYHLTVGDKFQVETALFDATPAVGDVVTGGANFKYVANASSRTTFVVEELTKIGWDARAGVLLRVLTV